MKRVWTGALFVLTACSDGSIQNGSAATPPMPPNSGTAPDHVVACIDRVRRDYAVAQEAVRLDEPAGTPDRVTIEGRVDKGAEGVKRFRCIFDADLRLTDVMALTSDGE